MKVSITFRFFALLLLTVWTGTNSLQSEVPAPSPGNVASCIQIQLPSPNGTILVVPDLINMQSHVSWALLLPGNSNLTSLTWHEVSFNLADSTYPAIVGLANKPGTTQFYIIYKDGTIALSTASATGISEQVVLGRDTNYSQFTYTKMTGKNALYLLTGNGNIDISRDGGQSWQVDSGGAPFNYFTDLAVDTFGNAYAFYTPGGSVELYKQEANSGTWLPANLPSGQLPTSLFIDRQNRFFISTYNNGVYRSLDTGNTWARSATNINGVQCGHISDDAFGNDYMTANGGVQLYRSIDTGADWTRIDGQITSQEVDSNYQYIFNLVSGDTVLTACTIYGVFFSTTQGNTWLAENTGLHETQFNGFFKSASGRFVETSNNGLFYEDPQATVFTHVLPAAGCGYAGPILADTLGNIYSTTQNVFTSAIFFWKSNNYGTSWQPDTAGVSVITSPGCFGVDEYGNEHLSGRGLFDVGLLYKKTAGTNSFVLDTSGLYGMTDPFYAINALASDDNGMLFLGGGGDASRLICWSRPVNGSPWALDTAGFDNAIEPVTYLTHEPNHNMIAIASGALYYHQSGRWNNMPFPIAPDNGNFQINAVAADSSGGIIASFTYYPSSFLYSYGYGIYCTHDHGTTWTHVGLTGVTVYGLYNFGDDTTYALSDLGIFALTCNGVVNPLNIIQPESEVVQGNMVLYPNPSSGLCHAAFTPASSASKSELSIIDISGRMVKAISIAQGDNEVSFNTTDMNSGIYFCILKSDDSIMEVKKLIVTR